jgi:CheY-like chemotaxis protein
MKCAQSARICGIVKISLSSGRARLLNMLFLIGNAGATLLVFSRASPQTLGKNRRYLEDSAYFKRIFRIEVTQVPKGELAPEQIAGDGQMNGNEAQPGDGDTSFPAAILLIDDNAVQAAARQTILKRAGYNVIPVLNPVRALRQFQAKEFPSEICLVITDHVMPGMSGSDFVRELRKTHQQLPVLVISGMEEAEDLYHDLDVHFRLKPLMPDNLLASVERLIQSSHADA